MAKQTAAPKVSVDGLVNKALVTVAASPKPLRLSGKAKEGQPPALFPSAAGANKEAIARLTDVQQPLIVVGNNTITLTAEGFSRIAGSLPEEKIGSLAKTVAESLAAESQVAFLEQVLTNTPTAAVELEPLLRAAVKRQEEDSAARIEAERKRAERLAAAQEAMKQCQEHLTKLQSGRREELKELLRVAGGTPPERIDIPTPPTPPSVGPRPEPRTDEDRDFRRDVAERLVSSWRDAVVMKKDEARRFLETALDNISGLRRLGEVGEQVPFKGAFHEDIPGLPSGQLVRITRSGWALEDGDDGEYVIQKASVSK